MSTRRGEHGAVAGIEERIVFHRDDSRLDRIQRATTVSEHGCASFQRSLERCGVSRFLFRAHAFAGDHACTAMDHQPPLGHGGPRVRGRSARAEEDRRRDHQFAEIHESNSCSC